MNEIDKTYLELETTLQGWSQRMDAFATRVGNDEALRARIDELKLKQRLAHSALEALRTDGGKKWETTKVMISHAWNFCESVMHFLGGSATLPLGTVGTLSGATMHNHGMNADEAQGRRAE